MSYQGRSEYSIHWYHENLVWSFPKSKESKLRIANTLLWWGWSKEQTLKTVRGES